MDNKVSNGSTGSTSSMEHPIRVLCIDDNPQFTGAWERLINMQPDMKSVGTRRSADDLVSVVREVDADLVLLDISMAGKDPIEAVQELSFECPEVRVVICSGWNDSGLKKRATDAGAWAYVDKLEEPERILELIRNAN